MKTFITILLAAMLYLSLFACATTVPEIRLGPDEVVHISIHSLPDWPEMAREYTSHENIARIMDYINSLELIEEYPYDTISRHALGH